MYNKLTITETARNSLREEPAIFNRIVETFPRISEVIDFLKERYGKMPKGKNKIQCEPNGEVIGFLHSYWNEDFSHASGKWFQTDWIEVTEVYEKPILIV